MIALSQLNDEGKLRDSRTIGHDADIVLKIESAESDNDRVIAIAKQRDGERNKRIPVQFLGEYMQFRDP